MVKRSPRYPRISLVKAVDMTRKLFDGAHQSKLDVDTAARVIGYSSSTGGAAASAIGALRQYGLVDGLRGDVAVSDLAMRILQPMDELERYNALLEASAKPEIFGRVNAQFGGKLPASDEPIRAYLIRQEGFSAGGADELIQALRSTNESIPTLRDNPYDEDAPDSLSAEAPPVASFEPQSSGPSTSMGASGELIVLPLGSRCRAELRFIGEVTGASYARLIRHLQLLSQMLDEEDEENWAD